MPSSSVCSQANGQQPYPMHWWASHQRTQRLRNTVSILKHSRWNGKIQRQRKNSFIDEWHLFWHAFIYFPQNTEQQQSNRAAFGTVFRPLPPAQRPFVRQPVSLRLQARLALPAVVAQDSQAGIVHPLSRAGAYGRFAVGRHAQAPHAMR